MEEQVVEVKEEERSGPLRIMPALPPPEESPPPAPDGSREESQPYVSFNIYLFL